jgi:hypothetical protein
MSVSTYGSVARRDEETSASRCNGIASAKPKPKRSVAANAQPGRHLPKMTAASAMKPRPLVMFSAKVPTNPIERKAPPSAASTPETTTAA